MFQGCTSLESVDIPASVQSIGSSAFNGCTSLESISLPEALTIISSSLFQGCTSLGSIVVPDKVTTIESNAFYGCTAMESVVIGSNVKKINSQSFYNCSNLKIVYIHSKFIAYTDVSSTSAIGYLLQYAAVVNILAEIDDVNDAYINLHPHIEIINQNGVEYVSYSKHMHIWQQNRILVETVECENDGLARYYCVDCDIMNDVVLRCHDIINHEGREPGCLEDGYKAYETCSRCDYTTFEVIPAHGHMIESEVNIIVDPFDTKNDIFYPFTYEDGKFTSNNHDHSSSSSFVVVATHACDINVYATISSESGCDRLTIYRNGTSIATISGTQTFTQTISLQVGDKLTFTYSKDGSVNGGTDSTTITMTYDKISVVEKSYVSVNDADISCDKDVVCDICDTLVREAAEHDMGDWHTGDSEGTEIRECNNCSYKESH